MRRGVVSWRAAFLRRACGLLPLDVMIGADDLDRIVGSECAGVYAKAESSVQTAGGVAAPELRSQGRGERD